MSTLPRQSRWDVGPRAAAGSGAAWRCALALLLGCGGASPPNNNLVGPADPGDPAGGDDPGGSSAPTAPAEPSEDGAAPPPDEAAAAVAASQPDLSREAAAILAAHNRLRSAHCARPLRWSDDLAATAQAWADSLRDRGCRFEHSRTAYGENLAAGTSLSADNAVALWAQEGESYSYRRASFSMETGHFTQMVWGATRQIGCGASECQGMRLWVCHYDPPGNVLSLFAENVLPEGCR
jgi:pathogenesis-related protein 1